MPAVVQETFRRSRGEISARRGYLVTGVTNEAEAYTAVLVEAPTSIGSFDIREASVDEVGHDEYEAFVTWSAGSAVVEPPEDGDEAFSFELSPAAYMVYQSRETIAKYPNGATTPQYRGAINVDQEGRVNGVQWPPSPAQVFTQQATVDAARITQSYYRTLCALAGKVNDATFLGFAAGELLFLGATGRRQGAGPWQIEYKFGFSANEEGLTVGTITGIAKKGWEFLWAHYRTDKYSDGTNDIAIVQVPVFAYVERIVDDADFGDLEPPA